MDGRFLQTVQRWTLILAAIVIAAANIAAARPVALAVTVGAGLMCLNAMAMRRIGARLVRSADRPGMALLLLNVKLVAIIGVIFVLVHYLRLDLMGLLVGVSVFPVAIVAAAVKNAGAAASPAEGEQKPNG